MRSERARPMARGVGLLLLLLAVAPAAAVASTPDAVHREGSWLVDSNGAVVIAHGFNIVQKNPPYVRSEFGKADARFLASQGFTVARVPFIWEAVEPEPGRYDDVYIARVLRLQLLHVSTAVPGATLRPEALSRIFVPRRMYPNGYVVRASNAQVNSRKNARVLMLSAGQHKSVSVTVAPAGG